MKKLQNFEESFKLVKKWRILTVGVFLIGTFLLSVGMANTAARKELIFWTTHVQFPHYSGYIEMKGKEFVRLHPEISGVKVVVVPYEGYLSKFLTAFMGRKNAPDMFEAMTHQWAGLFDFADPVPEDFLKKVEEKIVPYVREQGMGVDGIRYGIPTEGDNFIMLYINTDMFTESGLDPDKPLTNFSELLNYARKLTKYDKSGKITREGIAIRYSGHPIGITDKYTPFLHGMGGRLVAPDWSTADGYVDSPESLKTLTYYTDLVRKWKVASLEVGTPATAFAQGLAAMIPREGWYAGYLRDNAPDIHYKVYPFPLDENALGPTVYPMFPWVNMVYKYSPNKDLAWKFFEYWWTVEDDLEAHRVQDMLGVWKENLNTEWAKTRPFYKALMTMLENQPYAPAYYHPKANKLAFEYGASVLNALFGQMPPEAAIEEARVNVNALLK